MVVESAGTSPCHPERSSEQSDVRTFFVKGLEEDLWIGEERTCELMRSGEMGERARESSGRISG
jgi:hypothetical protein